MFDDEIMLLAATVVREAAARGLTVATAESCTGGLVAGAITAIAGSSTVLDRGFVTYSNAAKTELVGVPAALIEAHGAVSEPVARAMAQGAARDADVTVAVTGIAGPGGGSEDKPVGLVHFAAIGPAGVVHQVQRFGDIGRERVRRESVCAALALLLDRVRAA